MSHDKDAELPICEYCGDEIYPWEVTKRGMHLSCWREGKAMHDHDTARDDRLTGDAP